MKTAKMDGFTLCLNEQGKVKWATYPEHGTLYPYVKIRWGVWQIAQGLSVSQVRGRYRRGTLAFW